VSVWKTRVGFSPLFPQSVRKRDLYRRRCPKRLTESDPPAYDCSNMTQEFQRGRVTVTTENKFEVKVGSGSVIVDQCELHNLIEALSEARGLVAHDRALMEVGSA
jgi:hypothetical protein